MLACSTGKQSETHSKTVQGWSNLTVGEHDRQKCERKLIEFEGEFQLYWCLEGSGPSKVACRVFSKGFPAREERQHMTIEDKNPKWAINYDLLIDSGVFKSSTEQSEKKKKRRPVPICISCCHLVAKLCQYTISSHRISFDQTLKFLNASKKQRNRVSV